MPSFPKHAIVNIPAEVYLDGECFVSVRLHDADDVFHVKDIYHTRLLNVEINGEVLRNIDFIKALKGTRVRIILTDHTFEKSEIVDALLNVDPVFVIRPDGNAIRNTNFLSSFNFRVHFDVSAPNQSEDSLLQAADFYLHNPLLTSPIEPFHTLLSTIIGRSKHSLWDIQAENVHTNFYVSDSYQVSLSKRWNTQGLNYGNLDDSWDAIASSKLYQELSAFRLEIFRRKGPCIFCPDLELCGGFLRAIHSEWPCESWQHVFIVLRDEAGKAKKLQRKIDIMSHPHH